MEENFDSRTNPTSMSMLTSRPPGSALYASKKKGKKNKSKNNKESGFAWATSYSLKPFESETLRDLVSTACAPFEGRTGKPLAKDLRAPTDIPKNTVECTSGVCDY